MTLLNIENALLPIVLYVVQTASFTKRPGPIGTLNPSSTLNAIAGLVTTKTSELAAEFPWVEPAETAPLIDLWHSFAPKDMWLR
jgi:hypothetical protein